MSKEGRFALISVLAVIFFIMVFNNFHRTTPVVKVGDTATIDTVAVLDALYDESRYVKDNKFVIKSQLGGQIILHIPETFQLIDKGDKNIKEYLKENELDDNFTGENYTSCWVWGKGDDYLICEKIDSSWILTGDESVIEKVRYLQKNYTDPWYSSTSDVDELFSIKGTKNTHTGTYRMTGRITGLGETTSRRRYGPVYIVKILIAQYDDNDSTIKERTEFADTYLMDIDKQMANEQNEKLHPQISSSSSQKSYHHSYRRHHIFHRSHH